MNNLNILYIWTKDNLRLEGVHYIPENKDICVLVIHGMSGNFIENKWGDITGQKLSENGIGFIYAHNRGYNHINDIATKEIEEDGGYKTVRMGAAYERFTDCVSDIDAWINEVRNLGYKKIILLGHSLGCNKTIYYLHRNKQKDILGVVLASPPDMVALVKKSEYQLNYKELLEEAKENVKRDEPRKLLSGLIWDWFILSSQTFLDLFGENGPADNLPVLRNPKEFPELASIDVPILAVMGEHDDIAVRTLKEDLDLIETKAINCPSFTKQFIKGGNHNYEQQEELFANTILNWISSVIKR